MNDRSPSDLPSHDAAIRDLLDQSVAAIYVVDFDQKFVHINTHFAQLCGYAPSEMIGHPVLAFIADHDVDARRAAFARMATGGETALQNVVAFKRKDGEIIELLAQNTLARYDGTPAIVGVATDVTARNRAEHALQRANRALETMRAASSALIRAERVPELLQEMCDVALTTGAYSAAWVGIAEHDAARSVRPAARAGFGADDIAKLGVTWDDSPRGRGPTGTAIRTGRPTILRNFGTLLDVPIWRALLEKYGVQSCISLPLHDAPGVFGALTLYSTDARAFDEQEVALLVQLAGDISYGAAALRNRAARLAAEEQARDHARRLETLWKVLTNPRLAGVELWLAMLAEAVHAIRPGRPYFAALLRVADGEIVVEAVAETPEYAAAVEQINSIPVGARFALTGTAIEKACGSGGGTHVWDDLQTAVPSSQVVKRFGWRSAIATIFEVGGVTYSLWFSSTEQTGPWEAQDRAYVEVLASFFASQAQLSWQFEQLRRQQTHDVLTNVFNRSHFRSQARLASLGGDPYAVVALNIDRFGEVNETHGSMTGDALLVEVAAALSQRAEPGEIVGRLGGDAFAVFIPAPRSAEFVLERALCFAERFEAPFSIGDREGTAFVPLTASFGVAWSPQHGTAVDTIISHATLAIDAARTRGRGAVAFYEPPAP